ncbi:Ppx/GppA phosphatase family protein [Marmoricola sp. RAF53]|uniref:Ppx/GppA phosphatase family protein n=1 Tax=Marmoricola sp. RAF53 TaxID=3233059 RepID=UPI003F9BDF6A
MTRVAAFDCGTNSLRLLIADLDPGTGELVEHVREMRIVRLGQGVDRTGRISAESMERALGALDEYAMLVTEYEPDVIRFCATSAARDAENAAGFVDAVRSRIGVDVEVIGGDEEARASYEGATRVLHQASVPVEGPCLVLDIGGGSTELILGSTDGAVELEHSLDIGSVRLTERHLHSDPPTAAEVAALRADVDAVLDTCRVDPGLARTVVGVAGTVTTVAAGVLALPAYDRDRVHLAALDVEEVYATVDELVAMTVAERRALGYMHPGRADVIGAGALILERVLRRTAVSTLVVSESDILDGIAWSTVR